MTKMADDPLSLPESTTSPSSDPVGQLNEPSQYPSETSNITSPSMEGQGDTPVSAAVPVTTRRWVMIVTGTMPGRDKDAERERILGVVERDLLALAVTDEIHIVGTTFRSEPMLVQPGSNPDDTGIAPVVPGTDSPDTESGSPSSASSPPSSSDGPSSESSDSGDLAGGNTYTSSAVESSQHL